MYHIWNKMNQIANFSFIEPSEGSNLCLQQAPYGKWKLTVQHCINLRGMLLTVFPFVTIVIPY